MPEESNCNELRIHCMLCGTVQYCEKLDLPFNGTLDTEDVVYSTVVNVTCDCGFILPDGNLTQSVECIDANYSVIWNDTVDNCQRNYLYFIDF